MRRFFFKILPGVVGLVLVLIGIGAAAPFTEFGSRMLIRAASGFLPVQLEYAGGSLARRVRLASVSLETEGLMLEVLDMEAELELSCLWNSHFCFRHLSAGTVELVWDGGSWRSGATLVRGSIRGYSIVVDELQSADAILTLGDPSHPRTETGDGSVSLPVDLQVRNATLQRAVWDIYGTRYQHESIALSASWVENLLELDQLEIGDEALGIVQLSGELTLSGDWPFELAATANWHGTPALADVLQQFLSQDQSQADNLSAVTLLSPWTMSVKGTRVEQSFSVKTALSGLGYEALELSFSARHPLPVTEQQGELQLVFDRINLRDRNTQSELSGSGELTVGEVNQWTLSARSTGFTLPVIDEGPKGRLSGAFEFSGDYSGESWDVAFTDIDLRGDINELPAHVEGRLNLNQALLLTDVELGADLNGASLQLTSQSEEPQRLEFQLNVADLGRWLDESSGSLTLSGALSKQFRSVKFQGGAGDFQWRNLVFKQGDLSGHVDLADGHEFTLTADFFEAALNSVPLDKVSVTASGNEHRQSLRLKSTGGIEFNLAGRGELSLPEARGSVAFEGGVTSMAALLVDGYDLSGNLKLELEADWNRGASSAVSVSGEVILLQPELRKKTVEGLYARVNWDSANLRFSKEGENLYVSADGVKNKKKILAMAVNLPGEKDQPLSGELELNQLDLQDVQALAPGVTNLEGMVNGQIKLSGTAQQLLGQGEIDLVHGSFSMVDNPTVVEELQLKIKVLGDKAVIRGGLLLGGGKLDITGNLGFEPQATVNLRLHGEREALLFPPSTQVLVSHDINLKATADSIDVSGELVVHEGVLQHEELPEGAVALSDDVVVLGYVGPQPRRLDLGMDVQVTIEDHFKVVGNVVDVTVGGELHLLQKRGRPLQLFGNLNVVGGELRAYGQHLKVKRGVVAFSGAPENPALDMRAERVITGENITVGLELGGTLEEPVLQVYSDPVMSQSESLSYLMRGRGLDTGASADGTAMALSMGASLVNQTGVLGKLDRVPGISGVEIGAEGGENDTTATVSGYIGNRIYLSYGVGLYEPINVLTARFYLQTRLWLEVVSSLENSLDLYYSFDIE